MVTSDGELPLVGGRFIGAGGDVGTAPGIGVSVGVTFNNGEVVVVGIGPGVDVSEGETPIVTGVGEEVA